MTATQDAALAGCRRAGVRVVMITGDYPGARGTDVARESAALIGVAWFEAGKTRARR